MEISFLELILKGIPEGILMVFAMHLLCDIKIQKKAFFQVSISLIVTTYLIRLLPINFGFHTIVSFFILSMMCNLLLNIPIVVVTKGLLKVVLIVLICEMINMLLINLFAPLDIASILQNPIAKIVYTIPSTIIFALIDSILWYRQKKVILKETR